MLLRPVTTAALGIARNLTAAGFPIIPLRLYRSTLQQQLALPVPFSLTSKANMPPKRRSAATKAAPAQGAAATEASSGSPARSKKPASGAASARSASTKAAAPAVKAKRTRDHDAIVAEEGEVLANGKVEEEPAKKKSRKTKKEEKEEEVEEIVEEEKEEAAKAKKSPKKSKATMKKGEDDDEGAAAAAPPPHPSAPPPGGSKMDTLASEDLPRNVSVPDPLSFEDDSKRKEGDVRITSWNILSFKSAMTKGFMRYIEAEQADVVFLSETKVSKLKASYKGLRLQAER